MKHQFKITETSDQRLDHFVVSKVEIKRSLVTKLIKEGKILVNQTKVKPGYQLKRGDLVDIVDTIDDRLDLTPQQMDLNIVYEDSDLLVINKPKGLVVHPAKSHRDKTLVHGLLYQMEKLSDLNGTYRPGILHRIDKDTSGLLIVAKTNAAHQILSNDLAKHLIQRTYYCLVHGSFEESEGTIEAPIGRDPKSRIKQAVIQSGKNALTFFKVKRRFQNYTLLECRLETGRTHQIRVHLAYIGHPIVGDQTYGFKHDLVSSGQMLHAHKLSFTHPTTKKAMTFHVPLPEEFETILSRLN